MKIGDSTIYVVIDELSKKVYYAQPNDTEKILLDALKSEDADTAHKVRYKLIQIYGTEIYRHKGYIIYK